MLLKGGVFVKEGRGGEGNVVKLLEEAYARFCVMEFSRLGREKEGEGERERVELRLCEAFWLVTFSLNHDTRMQTRIVGRIL